MSSAAEYHDIETQVRSCYATWSTDYYRDYYESSKAYPPVHTDIVRQELSAAKAKTVIDAGCGPASMLRDLVNLGTDRWGFDLTPEMVIEARRVLAEQGLPNDRIWEGNVLDPDAYRRPLQGYGAALCFGVLPHVPVSADATVLANLTAAVGPNGLVLLEARNQLFSLFTLNRYSRDFFRKTLIDEAALRAGAGAHANALDEVFAEIDGHFRLDLPPLRRGKAGEPGYDELLSRTHNPFELAELARRAGLQDVEILFYHYHCLPPLAADRIPDVFRTQSLAMENPRDWRGHFMASAFIVKGTRRGGP